MIWEILLAFFGMIVLDFVWARYTISLVKQHATVSGTYAAIIMLLNGTVVLTYVHSPWMIIPAAAGAFVGTFIGGKVDKWFP